jgi:hypothetical protein
VKSKRIGVKTKRLPGFSVLNFIDGTQEDGLWRSGNKDRITERLKKRMDEGYDIENIINAVKYEVWWRVNESKKTNDNKLQYMRGMEAWINDTENLDSMIERSLKSTDFQNLINNRLPDEPKRQVKIY